MAKQKQTENTSKPRKRRSGTHYEPSDVVQLNMRVAPDLKEAFQRFTADVGLKSAGTGALIVWMALEEYPRVRDKATRAGLQMTPEAAVREVLPFLERMVADRIVERSVQKMPEPEKAKFLADHRQEGGR